MRAPRFHFALSACALGLLGACQLDGDAAPPAKGAPDPAAGEVALGSRAGWDAYLLLDEGGVGVWTVRSYQVFEQLGSPEVIALDDLGRLTVLVPYSGTWTPLRAVHDGRWLGALAQGDVDPRVEGKELYASGVRGNVYQVFGHRSAALDARVVAELPGREVHTLVAGELEPWRPGEELLAFTNPGGMAFLRPEAEGARFHVEWLGDLAGRVRDAVVFPALDGGAPWIATASRAGRVELLRFSPQGPEWMLVHEEEVGFGRIALRPLSFGTEAVLYSTADDGRVLRHARDASGKWITEIVYAGPQGPRGLVAGAFTADPSVECLVVYGYSGAVELLVRDAGAWRAETIFEEPERGHWLAVAELDGRNATPEILASGYAGRVILLARPPGYGLGGVATGSGGR